MRVGRTRSAGRALGTLAVAAGGFTAGGLGMALGLSVLAAQGPADPDARVILQDASSSGSSSPPSPTPRSWRVRAAASPSPSTRRAASVPGTTSRARRPPVVRSTGS